jgi:acetyltransferase
MSKPLVVHTMYASHRSAPLRILGEAHVPVVESLDVACRCIAETWIRGRVLATPPWRPDGDAETVAPVAGRRLKTFRSHESLARARAEGRDALTEPEAQALLRAAGLTFPPSALCTTVDEVEAAVAGMQTAVALKVVSAKIPHKTDAGGVALGLLSGAEAVEAFLGIMDRTARYLAGRGAESGVDGVLVTPMLAAPLAELLVGARRDPDVGPVLTLGAGGIWVEVLRDVAHRVLPVDADEVRAMLKELRTYGLLSGARGRPPADLDAVVDAAAAVARCVLEHEEVAEVEVNPLFVYAAGAQAVDARIFLGGSSV